MARDDESFILAYSLRPVFGVSVTSLLPLLSQSAFQMLLSVRVCGAASVLVLVLLVVAEGSNGVVSSCPDTVGG